MGNYEKLLGKYKENSLILLGIGEGNEEILKLLNYHNITVKYFCDNKKENWGKLIVEIPIISPSALKEFIENSNYNITILIAIEDILEDVSEQLRSFGTIELISFIEAKTYLNFCDKCSNMYHDALLNIYQENLVAGMDKVLEVFNEDNFDENTIKVLNNLLYNPQQNEINESFNRNISLLNDYPYIFNKEFININDNNIKMYPTKSNFLYLYDRSNMKFEKIEINSNQETKYFFKDLDNPIFVENEFNQFNLNFLVDNVRMSEDVAYDNHIYLYYDNIERFSILLYYCNFESLLLNQKIIILIGEQEKIMYPINFKESFNIDYGSMGAKELRIEEIKRIVLQQHFVANAGNDLFVQSFDGHSDILNMGGIGDSLETAFGYYNDNITLKEYINLVKKYIKSNKLSVLSEILVGFKISVSTPFKDNENEFIKFFNIFENIVNINNCTSKKDWLCANYLAFTKYSNLHCNSRITPILHHVIHVTVGKNKRITPTPIYEKLIPILEQFKYFKSYAHIRDPIISIRGFIKKINNELKKEIKTNFLSSISSRQMQINFSLGSLMYNHKFEHKIFIRFEDMKLNPKATLVAICKWLNIPYNSILEVCTFMGKPIYIESTIEDDNICKVKSGFSVYPMYPRDMYENLLSKENIELLESFLYPTYSYFGYKPIYETNMGKRLNNTDFETIKRIKFAFEEIIYKDIDLEEMVNYKDKKIKLSNLIDIYRNEFYENGIEYKNKTLSQISNNEVSLYPLLQPDEKYLVNPIYENINSLPKLEDIDVHFIEKNNPIINNFDWNDYYRSEFKRIEHELIILNSKLEWNRNEVSKLKFILEKKEKEIFDYKNKFEYKENKDYIGD